MKINLAHRSKAAAVLTACVGFLFLFLPSDTRAVDLLDVSSSSFGERVETNELASGRPKELTISVPFSELLRGEGSSSKNFLAELQVSPRQKVENLELRLVLNKLMAGLDAGVLVKVNNRTVGEVRFDEVEDFNQPFEMKAIEVVLREGGNFLQLYIDNGETLERAIDFEKSEVIFDGSWVVDGHHLGRIDSYFVDKVLRKDTAVHFSFPSRGNITNAQVLSWGGQLSQAIALRMGGEIPKISFDEKVDEELDNFVIGTVTDLDEFLDPEEIENIVGPYLGIRPLSEGSDRLMFVVGGRTEAEVAKAALAFGMVKTGFPHVPGVVVDRVSVPTQPVHIGLAPVFAGATVGFDGLGFDSSPMSLREAAEGVDLALKLDVMAITDEVNATVDLLTWSPRRVESPLELELSINEELFDKIILDYNQGENSSSRQFQVVTTAPDGLHWQTSLRFEVPMMKFRTGWNDVSFRVVDPPILSGVAQADSFAILGASRITVPAATPSIKVPDLALMSQSSFPFVPQPDGSNLEIALLEPNQESILAGWVLLAKLAQVSNTFLYNTKVHFGPAMGSREVLIVGRASKIQPLLAGTSLEDLDLVSEIRNGGAFLQTLRKIEESEAETQRMNTNRVTTYFTSLKIEDLEPFSREWVKDQWWNELNGDFSVLRTDGVIESFQIAEPTRLYAKPDIGLEDRGMFFDLVIQPVHWAGVLLGLSLPFAFITKLLLGPE